MGNTLVVNATTEQTRVALLENGSVVELFIERRKERGLVGNIYKGRVQRVLPGMQAAFVEIGLERAAFLYAGDLVAADTKPTAEVADSDDAGDAADGSSAESPVRRKPPRIEEQLSANQEVVVQIAKEAIGTKGARDHRSCIAARAAPGLHADGQPCRNLASNHR